MSTIDHTNVKRDEDDDEDRPSLAERVSRLAREPLPPPEFRRIVIRNRQNADAIDMERALTRKQRESIESLAIFGWYVWFIRRPLFGIPVVIIENPASGLYALLDDDGNLDMEPNIQLRR